MRSLRIGLLLGLRQIQRASLWTTSLIIFVMMLTFLNLIAVSGILVGLIEGAEQAVRKSALGDVVITTLDNQDHILETNSFIREISTYSDISTYSVRYKSSGTLEANYKERRSLSGERDTAAVTVTGIDPVQEHDMTGLGDLLVEGEYLNTDEEGYILIGIYYIEEYAQQFGDVFDTVSGISPGDTVRLTIGDTTKEFIVKGIVESKVDEVNLSTYIPEREFRRLFNRLDRNADQIVIRTAKPEDNTSVVASMKMSGLDAYTKILTYEENLPKFLIDIKNTFNVLGTFIGSIGIIVASITIFIIIFIKSK